MNTTFSEQIKAIQEARSTEDVRNLPKATQDALNDAGSSIAYLNLSQKKSELSREEYFEELLNLFTKHIEANDFRTETEIKEKIFGFIEENMLPDADYEGHYDGDGVFAANH